MRVLAFTAIVSLVTGMAFGLAPALLISKTNLAESLKEGRRGATASVQTNRMRSVLVVAEVALALVLLVGAGLLINSFVRLQQVAPGFDAAQTLTFNVAPSAARTSTPQHIGRLLPELTARLKRCPAWSMPAWCFSCRSAAAAPPPAWRSRAARAIPRIGRWSSSIWPAPGYFKTMGIPVIVRRDFTERDDLSAPPVLIVNEALARQYFPTRIRSASASRRVLDDTGARRRLRHARDRRRGGRREAQTLQGAAQPEIYFAQSQMPMSAMTVVVRAPAIRGRCSGRCAAWCSRWTQNARVRTSARWKRCSIARWRRRASTRLLLGCSRRSP